MRRQISNAVVYAGIALALAGCPKKNAAVGDAADGGAAASASVAPVAEPVNADEITRYPDEKKLDKVAATITRDGVVVHKSPPDGAPVATLASGAEVLQIAQDGRSFLVTFDDAESKKRMMGWVTDDAFVAAAPDAGRLFPAPKKDGGAPTVVDAGGGNRPVAVDAGGGNRPVAIDAGGGGRPAAVDAGGGGGGSAATGPVVAPSGGACPPNYTLLADDKMCHMSCIRGPECPTKFRCKNKVCQAIK
jgi:hypothetical protein